MDALTPAARPGIGAGVYRVDFHDVRNLGPWKGVAVERALWPRGCVTITCRNGATLRRPNGAQGTSAFTYLHAWRFLRRLPDVE